MELSHDTICDKGDISDNFKSLSLDMRTEWHITYFKFNPFLRSSIEFFTIRISVGLSDRSKVTQNKINLCQNLPPMGFELTTSDSSVSCSAKCAREESVGDF